MNAVSPVRSHATPEAPAASGRFFDPFVLAAYLSLIAVGAIAVFSATIAQAYEQADAFYYLRKQILYILLSLGTMLTMSTVPTRLLRRLAPVLLAVSIAALVLVVIPGIGIELNGSRRWLTVFGLRLQPSEISELGIVIFVAWHLTRPGYRPYAGGLRNFPFAVVILAVVSAVLLLLEPDLGSAFVIGFTAVTMLFLSGVRKAHIAAIAAVGLIALTILIVTEPYRLVRLTSFINPWADPWGNGYQLTQSLIAFGRGELLGTGIGTSVQKLFYLPHAGSDFLLAIIAEEFGFAGIALVVLVFATLVWRIFQVSWKARAKGDHFGATLAQGIGLLLALAALINMGVNTGLLPTKGLALPFMSIGGTSIVAYSAAIGIVLAIEREARYRGEA